jgi:type IV pilus assembly protein PilO
VFLVLIFVLYYVLIHTDIGSKIDNARRQSAQLDSDLAAQRQSQASYFADKDQLTMHQQRQRELNKALPENTEVAAFLSSIQQVSNVSGINLIAWQPQDEKSEAYYAKVPMKLEMTGRFHQIAKFIYEVGKLDRIINMENIELTDPKVVGADVILHARCLATSFHAIQKGAK